MPPVDLDTPENHTCPDGFVSPPLQLTEYYHITGLVSLVAFLVIFNLTVIGGNSLVIMAVLYNEKLRTVTNTFVVSLASADLLLGLTVLPFSSANLVLGRWPFGGVWCSVWLAVDVWLSTASILNLCAISLDRYLAIGWGFSYPRIMSPDKAKIMVTAVWVTAFLICFPPLIGWKEKVEVPSEQPPNWMRYNVNHIQSLNMSSDLHLSPNGEYHPMVEGAEYHPVVEGVEYHPVVEGVEYHSVVAGGEYHPIGVAGGDHHPMVVQSCLTDDDDRTPFQCRLNLDAGYVIYSACGSFWIPLCVMMFFYWRIYVTASKTGEALRRGIVVHSVETASELHEAIALRVHRGRIASYLDSPALLLRQKHVALDPAQHRTPSVDDTVEPCIQSTLTDIINPGTRGTMTPDGVANVKRIDSVVGTVPPHGVSTPPPPSDDDNKQPGSDADGFPREMDSRLISIPAELAGGKCGKKSEMKLDSEEASLVCTEKHDDIGGGQGSVIRPDSVSRQPGEQTRLLAPGVNVNREIMNSATPSYNTASIKSQKSAAVDAGKREVTIAGRRINLDILKDFNLNEEQDFKKRLAYCAKTRAALNAGRPEAEENSGRSYVTSPFNFGKEKSVDEISTRGGDNPDAAVPDVERQTAKKQRRRIPSLKPNKEKKKRAFYKSFFSKNDVRQAMSCLTKLNKEKKAAKTIAIIVGCFVTCWAPFFTVYLLGAFCASCTAGVVFTVFFWLGYFNSAINPFVYALCSKDFRNGFRRLLNCGRDDPRGLLQSKPSVPVRFLNEARHSCTIKIRERQMTLNKLNDTSLFDVKKPPKI